MKTGQRPRMSPINTLVRAFTWQVGQDRGEGSSRLVPSPPQTPTELPIWTESDSKEKTHPTEDEPRDRPSDLPVPFNSREEPREIEFMKLKIWNQEYPVTKSTILTALKRTLKSLVLVLKVNDVPAHRAIDCANTSDRYGRSPPCIATRSPTTTS